MQDIRRTLKTIINVDGIYSIHYFEFKSDFSFHGESHDFWELVYIDKGAAFITAGEQIIKMQEGEVIFHKPNEFHSIASDPENPPNVFIVCFDTNSEPIDFFCERRLVVPPPFRKYIAEIISDGREAFVLTDDSPYSERLIPREVSLIGSEQLIKLNLEMFLIKLIRFWQLPKKETTKDEQYDAVTWEVIRKLKNNIYGRLTVEEICNEVGFSRTYLSAKFKKNCGKTILEYLTELKIAEAKYLIRKDCHTVAEISDFLCFENPQYFCRVFKKLTKMTPSQYKNSVSYNKVDEK